MESARASSSGSHKWPGCRLDATNDELRHHSPFFPDVETMDLRLELQLNTMRLEPQHDLVRTIFCKRWISRSCTCAQVAKAAGFGTTLYLDSVEQK
eukprot:3077276-Pleurochrysis_carterae.AAC.1